MIIRITLIFFIIKRIKCYTQINKEKPNYLKFPFNTKIKEISKSDFSSTFNLYDIYYEKVGTENYP